MKVEDGRERECVRLGALAGALASAIPKRRPGAAIPKRRPGAASASSEAYGIVIYPI